MKFILTAYLNAIYDSKVFPYVYKTQSLEDSLIEELLKDNIELFYSSNVLNKRHSMLEVPTQEVSFLISKDNLECSVIEDIRNICKTIKRDSILNRFKLYLPFNKVKEFDNVIEELTYQESISCNSKLRPFNNSCFSWSSIIFNNYLILDHNCLYLYNNIKDEEIREYLDNLTYKNIVDIVDEVIKPNYELGY